MSEPRVSAPQGNTGNVIRDSALGLVSETLQHYLPLTAAIWDAGPLPANEIEMVRLRNANHVGCAFCKAARYDVAIEAGLDESRVALLAGDGRAPELSGREQLLLAFTDQYLRDPGGLSDDLKRDLGAVFSSEELVHLSLAVAYFNGFSRCAVALGGMPEELPRMEISVPR